MFTFFTFSFFNLFQKSAAFHQILWLLKILPIQFHNKCTVILLCVQGIYQVPKIGLPKAGGQAILCGVVIAHMYVHNPFTHRLHNCVKCMAASQGLLEVQNKMRLFSQPVPHSPQIGIIRGTKTHHILLCKNHTILPAKIIQLLEPIDGFLLREYAFQPVAVHDDVLCAQAAAVSKKRA